MPTTTPLARVVGLPGAVLLGLGSMVGTGVFVGLGLGAAAAGPMVVLATLLAAVPAACNALSSAQLATSHPVSGGTYEYGYRYLHPLLGLAAGWLFLCAKTASAATAALGVAGYLLGTGPAATAAAAGLVATITVLVAGGMRRSSTANAAIVTTTLLGLVALLVAAAPLAVRGATEHLAWTAGDAGLPGVLEATALAFVAFTGYGRLATLGEEVRDPQRTIPRAIVATVAACTALYVAVALVAVAALGAPALAAATGASAAPLDALARATEVPAVSAMVRIAAVTAMLGVLLNLLLGLSRVVLAMARRRDLPPALAAVDGRGSPRAATWLVGAAVLVLVATGGVALWWSFSACTVLVYYALTNLAALRLPAAQRRYPRWVAMVGLVACLGLAVQVEVRAWVAAAAALASGAAVRAAVGLVRQRQT